ncbi:hypothetical protein NliqN6_4820 [Naganishia liquefaciens]|uniref:Cytidyltransferase-like domain-containing protein n=1 Tax=Naganishia liquefaciens TaxID=104408 RepID=A0A8H3YGL3_9TREE|nr:hypothetical protein NliqN6_4820 [Naganishia liquefaciens]
MSKAPKSGPGIAPVLPAMGVHSYHNDSPPFSGATELLGEPDPMSLSSSQWSTENGHHMQSVSPSNGAGGATPHFASKHLVRGLTPPGGIDLTATTTTTTVTGSGDAPTAEMNELGMADSQQQQQQLPGSSSAHTSGDQEGSSLGPVRPVNPRVPTSQDDVSLSSLRSRRLLSGYLFGSPGIDPASTPGKENEGDSARATAPAATRPTDPTLDVPHPPPTPSTVVSGQEEEAEAEAEEEEEEEIEASGGGGGGGGMSPSAEEEHPLTGTDDALDGFLDGEADADDRATAVQAEHGGSQGYMRNEPGAAGEYHFPTHRLKRRMKDENKIPIVIVACGSFSPPTYLHLRMFEMAKDEIVESQTYEIMAGYYSPVSSYYKKAGLAPAHHRVRMCELAVEHTSTWLMVDPWEAGQPEYQRTAVVLDHFDEMLNGKDGERGCEMRNGGRRKYKVMLLAGGDLIESFGEPGVWSAPDLHIILGRFGCLIVERAGSDVWAFLLSHDILYHHRRNVIVIKQLIYNDISSTKVRLFVRRGMSIKYLLPNSVIQYIHQNKLYLEPDKAVNK